MNEPAIDQAYLMEAHASLRNQARQLEKEVARLEARCQSLENRFEWLHECAREKLFKCDSHEDCEECIAFNEDLGACLFARPLAAGQMRALAARAQGEEQ